MRELREFVIRFKKKNVSYDEFIKYLDEVYKPKEISLPALEVPLSVFKNDYLSALETIVKYLHENKSLRFSEISRLICRDQRAIGVTYKFARKKMKLGLKVSESKYSLPLSVISDRKMSVLESLVFHLRKTYSLSYHDISVLLLRDERTIWTVYQRALKKIRQSNK